MQIFQVQVQVRFIILSLNGWNIEMFDNTQMIFLLDKHY